MDTILGLYHQNSEAIAEEAKALFPSDVDYTFVLNQLASGAAGLSGAMANSPGVTSWYAEGSSASYVSYVTYTVHELGHNLGFDHSRYALTTYCTGADDDDPESCKEYGDPTGTMGGGGFSADTDDDGYQCFNGREWILT